MPDYLEIHLTGRLAPNHRVSARTLAHSLLHVQRAVDKLVIFEKRGVLRKYSGLASVDYPEADLLIDQLQPGSIRIPLVNEAFDWIGARLNGILYDQYQRAAHEIAALMQPIEQQVPAAQNRALQLDIVGNTQQDLIADQRARESAYLKTAVLGEINQLVSPLRSSAIGEEETITFRVTGSEGPIEYHFNKQISRNFNKLVTAKQLGPETMYTGILEGLGTNRAGKFKFHGKFVSSLTKDEMTLLVTTQEDADVLNDYNLKKEEFSFWACPIATLGAFDEKRGDIVFLAFPS